MAFGYCPKCASRLMPGDDESMTYAGVCSSCVTWDRTPGKRYQTAFNEGKRAAEQQNHKRNRPPREWTW